MPRLYKAGWGEVVNASSLELWPLRACFARLYNFSLPRDYRIPARLGLGSLWLGELRLRANNGAWKEKSSHLKETASTAHPSLDGHSRKIVTRELVYYILLGTLRSAQKCLWSNLRVEFSRDIHPWGGHFSRGLYRPSIELQMVAMDSWQNFDVFFKKKFQNLTIISWVIDGSP